MPYDGKNNGKDGIVCLLIQKAVLGAIKPLRTGVEGEDI